MSSIDERVVQMKFDNSQFQKGVSDTNKSLDDLKKGLNLDASAKSLEGLHAAGSKFSLANIASSVSDLSSKFSAMGVIGITALANITTKAMDAGLQLAKSLTVQPIMDGFNEYELKMGSIQTILANTAKDGTNLDQVKNSLNELNTYADKTIYNFGDMTRNIGLFTNAGIKLGDATAMIKGFSNEAAMSGTTSAAAAGAAYQLSQALSKGKITLEDWRSLTNAGMGNANMKKGITDIALAMGTMQKAGVSADSVQKDFNGTLEKGWLTAEVMQNYLKIQAGEMNAEQMKSMGLSQAQIDNFVKMQKIAEDAATKVRTWTQLMGTLKEAVGSGWATTWELLIGDFDQATELFTKVSNTLGKIANDAGQARNDLIKGWADGGGRVALIDALSSAFDSLMSILKVVGEAFREIFPPVTASTLIDLTNKFKAFIDGLKPGPETLDKIKRTFKGLFAVVDIGWFAIQTLWGVLQRLFKGMDGGGGSLLDITAKIGDFLVKVRDTLVNSEKFNAFFIKMGDVIQNVVKFITDLIGKIPGLLDKFPELLAKLKEFKPDFSGFNGAIENLKNGLEKLKPTGESVAKVWDGLINIFKKALEIGQKMAGKLGEAFKGIGGGMADATKGIDFNTILGILGTGMLAGIVVMIKKFMKMIKGAIEEIGSGGGIVDTIKTAFGGLTDTLGQMQATLKASTLILIAGAIALLTGSVVALSKIDANKLPAVLAAITVMFIQLSTAMAVLDKINITAGVGKMAAIGTGMILLAIAIKILASSVDKLGGMDWQSLLKGLVGVTALLGGLAGAMKLLPKNPTGMIATGIGMIAIAAAVKILASAVNDFAGMDWQKMMQGLIGVGIVLGGLALFTQFAKVNKGAVAQAGGLILLGVALKIMASAVLDFANMDPSKIQQGLGALTAVLASLAIFSRVVNPSGMVAMGVAMVILGAALKIIATAITDFGNIPWDVLGRGLAGMAGALVGIGIAMRLMPSNMLITATALVIVAEALKLLSKVLKDMGGMSWEEIAKGLVTLAGSLIIIAGAMYLMTGALPGAAALIIVAGALSILVPVLQTLGTMPWSVIVQGLTVLALVFVLLGAAGLILTPVIPTLIGLGIAIALLGVGASLAGVGMLAFATGLTALAAAGAVGTTVLVAAVTALLGLIPYAFAQIGLGIIAFAKVIGENIPVLVEAAVKLMLGFLDGINQIAPQIVGTLVNLLWLLINTIASNIGQFVDAGMKILIGFLQGIANNIGQVVTTATDVIVNFLNGIANNIGRIIDAGANIIVKFLEGLGRDSYKITDAAAKMIVSFVDATATAITNNNASMQAAGGKLAMAIIDGMTGGLASKVKSVADSAWEMGRQAIESIKSAIDSNSPSKETFKLGSYTGEGFALGITSLGTKVAVAARGVGNKALGALQDTISGASSKLDGGMTLNPVIRPVLDLSSVRRDSGLINGMIQPGAIDLSATHAQASVIATNARVAQETIQTNEAAVTASSDEKLTLIQNNYSPKALSPAEIYRNTRNQLSVAKGELKK